MAIYKWREEVSDPRRGPCDVGFHVPSSDEWNSINTILVNAGLNTESAINSFLKMPTSGLRDNSSSTPISGTYGYYWSCTPDSTNKAFSFFFRGTTTSVSSTMARSMGFNIRGIKDTPVVPNEDWVQLTTVTNIYRNQTEGLISLSQDGVTRFTIQDKNIGATTVYSGGTLTETNCGYFYQRGNNYGFPYSGTVTTSSTKVDASGYGPGNYYSSNTFITGSGDWSSVQNDNLWGGEE